MTGTIRELRAVNELTAPGALPVRACLTVERRTDGRINTEPNGGALLVS
jgi:hypothetical protein